MKNPTLDDQWEAHFSALVKYKEREGNCSVPLRYIENKLLLGQWVKQQRQNKLSDERRRRLSELGFSWNLIVDDWGEAFSKIKSFTESQSSDLSLRSNKKTNPNWTLARCEAEAVKYETITQWIGHLRANTKFAGQEFTSFKSNLEKLETSTSPESVSLASKNREILNQILSDLNKLDQDSANSKLLSLLEIMGSLQEDDKILSLVNSKKEGDNVEYKETLSWDVRLNKKNQELNLAVLKDVASFLNTDGGHLLIGVHDNGNILGIDEELNKLSQNEDKFTLTFKNLLRDRIGLVDTVDIIKYKAVKVKGVSVFHIECKPSKKAIYVDEKYLYLRSGPSSELLVGPNAEAYLRKRFP